MKKNTESLETETFYHIYNRGNNGEDIFREERNYEHFLRLWIKYIEPIADTYAYCLLKNHFHCLIKTKSESIVSNLSEKSPSKIMSNQFAKHFNSYTQSFNKAHERTGSLFENPFRRIKIDNDNYLNRIIAYIHMNPIKHGFVDDLNDYKYSSFHSHLLEKQTRLKRTEVISLFGNQKEYLKFHQEFLSEQLIDVLRLE